MLLLSYFLLLDMSTKNNSQCFAQFPAFMLLKEEIQTVPEILSDREKRRIARYVSKNLTASGKQIITDLFFEFKPSDCVSISAWRPRIYHYEGKTIVNSEPYFHEATDYSWVSSS